MDINQDDGGDDGCALARRRWLSAAVACMSLAWLGPIQAHDIGIVNPAIALPTDLLVLDNDGRHIPLYRLLHGRRTLLQLMFTGCSETCPLQGALFAAIQTRFAATAHTNNQLLSLSIDPMDDEHSLSAWLQRFGANRTWLAAVPSSRGIDLLRTSLQSGRASLRNHSSQVYFIDESGDLIWRTEDFPSTEIVMAIAKHKRWIV